MSLPFSPEICLSNTWISQARCCLLAIVKSTRFALATSWKLTHGSHYSIILNSSQFIATCLPWCRNSLTHLAFVMQWITRLMLSLLPDCARLNAEKGAFSTRSRVESCQRRLNPVALSVLSHGKNYDCHCPRCGPGAKDIQGCHCFHTCSSILGEAGERFLHLGMKTIASLAPGPQRGQ